MRRFDSRPCRLLAATIYRPVSEDKPPHTRPPSWRFAPAGGLSARATGRPQPRATRGGPSARAHLSSPAPSSAAARRSAHAILHPDTGSEHLATAVSEVLATPVSWPAP